MDKRYTVFVSSTFKDLVDARWAVARALMRLNLIPLGMENFTASDKGQWEIIKKTIDLSDYYVLILGNCYGSIDPETGISYTEKEYRYALGQGIPCLTFVSKDVPLKPEHREPDAHRKKLDAFRAEASAGRMVDFWTNPDELTAKVATAIVMSQMESPRPGWVRNPQTSPEVAEEMARLSRENAELSAKMQAIQGSPEVEKVRVRLSKDNFTINSGPNQGNYTYGSVFRLIGPQLAKNPAPLDTLARIASRAIEGTQIPSDEYYAIAMTALELFSTLGLITAHMVDPSGMSGRSPYFTLSELGQDVLRSVELDAGKE